jgi:sec-independent protein translocase protein TatB
MFPEGRLLDFLIVGAVALIVVGPKDLPVLMRKVGQFMAKVRGMAAEFRASFDELARQSELDELRKEVQALRTASPLDYVAGPPGAGGALADIHTDLTGVHAEMTALASPATEAPQPAAPVVATPPEPAPEPTPKAPAS